MTEDSTLDPMLFRLMINDLPGDAIFNIIIHAYGTTQNRSKCKEAFDLGQHKVACWSNFAKIQLVLFDQSSKSGVLDVEINRSNIYEKLSCEARVVFLL